MELTTKNFKTYKTKNYIKKNNIYFFFNCVNQNSQDWLITEQIFKKMNVSYYKIFNKITIKLFKESRYNTIKPTINSITIFISSNNNIKKILTKNETSKISLLFFTLVAIKFNNKVYSGAVYKIMYSQEYIDNKLIFYKFSSINLKLIT
jgi:hypothetical protein